MKVFRSENRLKLTTACSREVFLSFRQVQLESEGSGTSFCRGLRSKQFCLFCLLFNVPGRTVYCRQSVRMRGKKRKQINLQRLRSERRVIAFAYTRRARGCAHKRLLAGQARMMFLVLRAHTMGSTNRGLSCRYTKAFLACLRLQAPHPPSDPSSSPKLLTTASPSTANFILLRN